MKLLFIPNPMPAHLIPLLSLAMRLDKTDFTIAFLISKEYHSDIENKGFDHLHIDRKREDGLTPEFSAIASFNPDVIIDDLNNMSYFSTKLFSIPRVSIVRKGILPFESDDPNFILSSAIEVYFKSLDSVNFDEYGLDRPESISDLFKGDVSIIPSIESVESLSEKLENKAGFVYSGPLLLSDEDMIGSNFHEDVIPLVMKFLNKNKTKRIVYLDLGISQPSVITDKLEECFTILFSQPNVIILTNYVGYTCKDKEQESRMFASSFLPSNLIYERAELAVHKCGSGSYNHQINNEVFSITLGSNRYDRDAVAIRLEELGVSKFLSLELSEKEYYRLFKESVIEALDNSPQKKSERQKNLAKIKEEIRITQEKFDFEGILRNIVKSK